MPTCSYFLRGVCTREVCPYLHVSVGRHAKVCLDFARGYCPNGEEVGRERERKSGGRAEGGEEREKRKEGV